MKDWNGNGNSIYKTLGASNHTNKERENHDFYATDPIAIDKLIKIENLSKNIFEPSAGNGHLSERLKNYGFNVVSNDLIQRDYELNYNKDFLKDNFKLEKDFDIITNPPYKFATEFVKKALSIISSGHKVCMFLKLTFLEGVKRYNEIYKDFRPTRIHVFSKRVLCAKNGDFKTMIDGGGSAVAYAWFVWEKDNYNKTEVDWI